MSQFIWSKLKICRKHSFIIRKKLDIQSGNFQGTAKAHSFHHQAYCFRLQNWKILATEKPKQNISRNTKNRNFAASWKFFFQQTRQHKKNKNARTISPFIEAGEITAVLVTKSGNIYVGVCIDTPCTVGMCAKRNAIANMITNGKSKIDKMVAIIPSGKAVSSCGTCREYMM